MTLASEALNTMPSNRLPAHRCRQLSSLNGNQISTPDELFVETGHDFNFLIEPVAAERATAGTR